MKILFTGGGTGGHVIPIIAIIREIRRIYEREDLEFFYLGPKDEFGQTFLSQEGIKIKHILAGKIRRYSNWKAILQNLFDIFIKIPVGIIQAFFYLFFLSPDLIFCKGGFGSIPGVIAGKLLLCPVFLHESDVTPGMANRFLSGFALETFVSFPKTEYFPLKKMILVGNPIRRELWESTKEEAKSFFNITSNKPVVLIMGGSQGAQIINDEILEVLPEMLESFEVLHQCGEKNYTEIRSGARIMLETRPELEGSYHLFPFLKEPELRHAYAVCDFIVSRAGAGSIFEIAAAEKPSILVPITVSAQNHQIKNAYAYQESGASIVIEESNFSSHFFLARLKGFFSQPEEMEKMSKAAKDFSRPYAAKVIAFYLVEYLTK